MKRTRPDSHTLTRISAQSRRSIGAVRSYFDDDREQRSTTIASIEAALDELGLGHLRRDRVAA